MFLRPSNCCLLQYSMQCRDEDSKDIQEKQSGTTTEPYEAEIQEESSRIMSQSFKCIAKYFDSKKVLYAISMIPWAKMPNPFLCVVNQLLYSLANSYLLLNNLSLYVKSNSYPLLNKLCLCSLPRSTTCISTTLTRACL